MSSWDEYWNELKEKAEKWDELRKCLNWGNDPPVEIILLQFHALNTDNQDKRKKLEAVKTHIKKEMEFHAPDMNEGAWLNDHLEAIMEILGEQSSTETPQ